MDINKDGIQNNNGEQTTPGQGNPTDENNNKDQGEGTPQQNVDPEGEVKISKAEFEKLQKKATDFDGIIEKQRIEKLKKREQPEIKKDEVNQEELDKIIQAKIDEKLNQRGKEEFDSNLTQAYKEFISVNPWADSDEKVAAISQEFSAQGAVSKSDLLIRIGQAAERLFPSEVEQARVAKIKAQVFAGQQNIDAGDTGGGSSRAGQYEQKKQLTAEQLEMCRKSGTKPEEVYPEYFKN